MKEYKKPDLTLVPVETEDIFLISNVDDRLIFGGEDTYDEIL